MTDIVLRTRLWEERRQRPVYFFQMPKAETAEVLKRVTLTHPQEKSHREVKGCELGASRWQQEEGKWVN